MIENHEQGMVLSIDLLTGQTTGVISSLKVIDAVGHRVVQGGETFSCATIINPEVKKAIKENTPLAPIHNPANLIGINMAERIFPGTPNVAVFDTEFHQTIPPEAFLYALPYHYYERYKVRRYGFHGTSHRYVAEQTAEIIGLDLDKLNLITCHMGNGSSVCAIKNGKCIDTSMGMTPLAGLMMGTRTGDFDPAIIKYLLDQTGKDIHSLDNELNKESGLKGICGFSDLRDIHTAASNGDDKAKLSLDMLCYQLKKYIGAYFAVLGRVDAVVFTAGIGENDPLIRENACKGLETLGIKIDPQKNKQVRTGAYEIHSEKSHVQLWVIPSNEEFQIALETQKILSSPVYGQSH